MYLYLKIALFYIVFLRPPIGRSVIHAQKQESV